MWNDINSSEITNVEETLSVRFDQSVIVDDIKIALLLIYGAYTYKNHVCTIIPANYENSGK